MAISPKAFMFAIHFGFPPYTNSDADLECASLTMMFSSCTARLAHCANKPFLILNVMHAEFSIDLVFPNNVANARSPLPFCCGVPGAVNSNLILKSLLWLMRPWKALFSPEMSKRIVFV